MNQKQNVSPQRMQGKERQPPGHLNEEDHQTPASKYVEVDDEEQLAKPGNDEPEESWTTFLRMKNALTEFAKEIACCQFA